MSQIQPAVRFAPSPNGELHLGHAYSALFTWRKAAELGAPSCCASKTSTSCARAANSLTASTGISTGWAWSGKRPCGASRNTSPTTASRLISWTQWDCSIPCFATRREIQAAVDGLSDHPNDPDGVPLYPGLSKRLVRGRARGADRSRRAYALRLDMALAIDVAGHDITFVENEAGPAGERGTVAVDPALWGDVILARKDVKTSYHLSVVLDDTLQGITDVTRGQDLFYATHVHRLLQALLELPEPAYHHHDLVRDDTGRRLSKSAKDQSLRALRDSGVTADDIKAAFGIFINKKPRGAGPRGNPSLPETGVPPKRAQPAKGTYWQPLVVAHACAGDEVASITVRDGPSTANDSARIRAIFLTIIASPMTLRHQTTSRCPFRPLPPYIPVIAQFRCDRHHKTGFSGLERVVTHHPPKRL